jgi:glycerophosphoryl diester phosphodiesterase
MASEMLLREPARPPAVVAHRGHSAAAPENTMAAVSGARQAGADWIEVDVRTTADGVPVVMHDPTVDRTTGGTGTVAGLTGDEIAALDAGSWFAPDFVGEPVPTFAQVLDDISERGGRLLLELKWPQSAGEVAVVLDMLRRSGIDERVVVQSFRPSILADVGTLAPELPRALLTTVLHEDPVAVCRELGLASYHPSAADVLGRPEVVDELHAAGVATMVWTVNDEALWPELAELGVDGLITDRAADVVDWTRTTR